MSRDGVAVRGFRAAGIHCGIKKSAPDLALIASDEAAAVAGLFTRSSVVGAPVTVSRERVRSGRARAVVVNSGISNVGMGASGLRTARLMTQLAARALGWDEREVLVASTGVIGEPLPIARLRRGIPAVARALRPEGLGDAARAILTTDLVPKIASTRLRLGGRPVTIAGIAKGSGMIEPRMATMLAFLVTDASVAPPTLRRMLRRAGRSTLNRITVDGETSTSDTTLLFANGVAGNPTLRGENGREAGRFAEALRGVCEELSRALVRDGEGATKLVAVEVSGARSPAEAERVARRIANSPLVKTAIFGNDPNWGRILQTVGAARAAIRLERAEIRLAGVVLFRKGRAAGPAARRRAGARLKAATEVELSVHLGAGRARDRMLTCDFSYDYVRINAEYHT